MFSPLSHMAERHAIVVRLRFRKRSTLSGSVWRLLSNGGDVWDRRNFSI